MEWEKEHQVEFQKSLSFKRINKLRRWRILIFPLMQSFCKLLQLINCGTYYQTWWLFIAGGEDRQPEGVTSGKVLVQKSVKLGAQKIVVFCSTSFERLRRIAASAKAIRSKSSFDGELTQTIGIKKPFRTVGYRKRKREKIQQNFIRWWLFFSNMFLIADEYCEMWTA